MFRFEAQTRFWLIAFVVVAALVWLFKPILLPFVAGATIAYFLAPVVDALGARKIPRWLGAIGVLLGFGLVAALLLILIVPILEKQIGDLINAIPGYIEHIRNHLIPWLEDWFARFSPASVEKIRSAATESVGTTASFFGNVLKHIISSGIALIDILALAIITPVVAFYLLRDWPKMTAVIDSSFPRRHYDTIKAQLHEINSILSGFVRGQALVCVILGAYYSLGLTAVGLQYGASIGFIAGLLSFIPFVGTSFGWVVSLILAFAQFDDPMRIILVVGIFLVGHVLETYILAPRLIGDRTGLHPVWIMFALIAGAELMGFTGVLIAVPVAAVIGVLTRFALRHYKDSAIYKDPLTPTKP